MDSVIEKVVKNNNKSEGDSNILKNLGTLLIALVVIVFLVVLVTVLNLVIHRVKFIQKLYDILEKKIFYNSLLRYGIQSYFKMAILGLSSSLSFSIEDQSHQINSLVTGFILLFLLFYPIFTYTFLNDHRS
jgi:tellurite resistance protein TehA-like permease